MSLNSALVIGVAGLSANASALSGISNNIANTNTVGYKRTRTDFSSLVTSSDINPLDAGAGVQAGAQRLIAEQGQLQSSSAPTDLGIAGAGFFVVGTATENGAPGDFLRFTRAGSFSPDEQGFLRNTAGYYLRGWAAQPDGSFVTNVSDNAALSTVNIASISGAAKATGNVQVNGNLKASQPISAAEATYDPTVSANNMASGAVTPDFVRTVQVFDSQGGVRNLNLAFLKSSAAANTWHVEIYASPASDVTTGAPLIDGQLAVGNVVFDANGQFDAANSMPLTLNFGASTDPAPAANAFNWASSLGVSGQTIKINLGSVGASGGLTQFDSNSVLDSSIVDGAVFGSLTGVDVDDQGFVTASFSNGVVQKIYQIPLATFINPNGLKAEDGDAFSLSQESGSLNLKTAGAGAGKISSKTLESSNVDLAKEFTNLITVQRAYSASSRIITTADQMLDELIRIKR
ncbi:MAG TPA: flagellar hook protein FlgE [Rhodobacteraceae bacterium]|nr:flagellar hook protein FlgE [Paracoccaceae bacterium]